MSERIDEIKELFKKKLKERLMQTKDGKVYVRIKP